MHEYCNTIVIIVIVVIETPFESPARDRTVTVMTMMTMAGTQPLAQMATDWPPLL